MKGIMFGKGLSGNALKIIALLTMTIDHIGMIMFPKIMVFRIIGRIAMPIFAFMIAEGCAHAKHKIKYFALVFGVGLLCVAGYAIAAGKIFFNVLITFSFSIAIIYALQFAVNLKKPFAFILPLTMVALLALVTEILPYFTGVKWLRTDYGFFGAMLPVMIYAFKDFRLKLCALTLGLTFIALMLGGVQWWAYLSLAFMIFYDGTRGKINLKYLFYVYYPLHLGVIYLIKIIL